MIRSTLVTLAFALLSIFGTLSAGDGAKKDADVVRIDIGDFSYTPDKATVMVGQKVVWKNIGDVAHTASSDKKDASGKRLFDTKALTKKKPESDPILFDQKLFAAFGGTPGGEVAIDYWCTIHGKESMSAKLVLKDAKQGDKKKDGVD